MTELERALDDLQHIRSALAQNHEFRGFGAQMLCATALGAFLLGAWQFITQPSLSPLLVQWVVLGIVTTLFLSIEIIRKARFEHQASANSRMMNVAECYLPSLFAGGILSIAIFTRFPSAQPLLPSLWFAMIAVGTFAAAPKLPKGMKWAAAWYLLCMLVGLLIPESGVALSALLTIGFVVGQLISAYVHLEKKHVI